MGLVELNLDANASYGTLPGLAEEALRLTRFGLNPSSIHRGGQGARALIEEARDSVAAAIGATSGVRIVFTSGATEANNMALMLPYWEALRGDSRQIHLLTTALEHPSVMEPARRLERLGVALSLARPQPMSALSSADVCQCLSPQTRLVSVMAANNETGEVFPVTEVASRARQAVPTVLVHTDAVQAFGKVPLAWDALAVDMLSISGHKIGALSGVGALVVRKENLAEAFLLGGPQEMHLRAGTENLIGIVSFGLAAQALVGEMAKRCDLMRRAVSVVRQVLTQELPNIEFNADNRERLPNTLSLRIPGLHADDLVAALDLEGIFVSSGAACASGKPEPSHVLLAMGMTAQAAKETLRISVRGDLGEDDARLAAQKVCSVVKRRPGGGAA